ncbi:MAG: PilZ domain-containing protein [Planctomycetota bacterium]|jgi:hypothetical protein
MNAPKIERLITEAIESRPKATNAPMNLYIHDGKVVCGARIVMPPEAIFIAHIGPHHLHDGFSDKEWKLIIEKIHNATNVDEFQGNKTKSVSLQTQESERQRFAERRREKRLHYRQPMWFGEDFTKQLTRGVTWDVSSGGLAFTCHNKDKQPSPGQNIVARFTVPRFSTEKSSETLDFERIGRICRVEQTSGQMKKVAIQFAKTLPFKPGEQITDKKETPEKANATTV